MRRSGIKAARGERGSYDFRAVEVGFSLMSPPSSPPASVVMQRLSYPTETVLSNNITRNRIVQSFKDSPPKPLRRRPIISSGKVESEFCSYHVQTWSGCCCGGKHREKERTDMACQTCLDKILPLFAVLPSPFQQNLS